MIDGLQMTFHHIGKAVPLDEIKDNAHTKYSPLYDMYSLDTTNDLSVPIELHAFGPDCSLDRRIQTGTHVGFKVNDVKVALQGQEIVMPLYQPFAGYQTAMVVINGQLIELIETTLSESEIWGDGIFKDSILYPDGKAQKPINE